MTTSTLYNTISLLNAVDDQMNRARPVPSVDEAGGRLVEEALLKQLGGR